MSSIDDSMTNCTIQNHNIQQLAKILNTTHIKDTDVTLVCADHEFKVHKNILVSGSPYFLALLHSGDDYSVNDRVFLNGVDASTLAIILNFLYTSELKAATLEDLCQVVALARVMDLKQLVKKCCETLISMLSTENYLKIWTFASLNDMNGTLSTKVMEYVLCNFQNIMHAKDFLSLTYEQFCAILNFSLSLRQRQDLVLHGIVAWIQHDLKCREKFAGKLFARVEGELVSKKCIKELLEDKSIKRSTELTVRLNELAVAVFVFLTPSAHRVTKLITSDSGCKSLKVTFISEYKLQTVVDKTSHDIREHTIRCNTIQQFDIKRMSWCQSKTLPLMGFNGAAMCQHQRNIYMVGGSLGSVCIKYNVDTNDVEYIQCSEFRNRKDAAMCVFKEELYVMGGHDSNGPKSLVHHASPNNSCWEQAKPLQYPRSTPTVLTSADHIYVVGGNNPLHGNIIECFHYSENYDETRWEVIKNPPTFNGYGVITSGFFVTRDILTGIHSAFGELVRWSYDHGRKKWQAKRFHINNIGESQITSVCKFQNPASSLMYFSTRCKFNPIPDCSWDMATYKWKLLPAAKGKCEIPNYEAVQSLYAVDV